MNIALKSRFAHLCAGALSTSAVFTLVGTNPAAAVTFNVNQSWTDTGFGTGLPASLTGTVDIPVGTYSFGSNQNVAAPFTGFNLTLNINGTNYAINTATIKTGGTSSVNLAATASDLTFSTSGTNGANDAYLSFLGLDSEYRIGAGSSPGFQFAANFNGGGISLDDVSLPTVFGTSNAQSVPEPGAIPGLLLTAGAILAFRKRYKNSAIRHKS